MGHPIKRTKVLQYLKQEKCDLVLLQETDLSASETAKLAREWVGEVLSSPMVDKKIGVVILIARHLNTRALDSYADTEGRWLEAVISVEDRTL